MDINTYVNVIFMIFRFYKMIYQWIMKKENNLCYLQRL